MAIRYRLGSVFWIIALLAVTLGWFSDRRHLETRHRREMLEQWIDTESRHVQEIQQLEARHGWEINAQWRARARDAVLLDDGLERQHQLAELLREADRRLGR
jgi:hypothetical protein